MQEAIAKKQRPELESALSDFESQLDTKEKKDLETKLVVHAYEEKEYLVGVESTPSLRF